jgi:ribonuclease HI
MYTQKIVFLTDALSVVTALKSQKSTELNELRVALRRLKHIYQKAVVLWIPSHCSVPGNEDADKLAREGSRLLQSNYQVAMVRQKLY